MISREGLGMYCSQQAQTGVVLHVSARVLALISIHQRSQALVAIDIPPNWWHANSKRKTAPCTTVDDPDESTREKVGETARKGLLFEKWRVDASQIASEQIWANICRVVEGQRDYQETEPH
jgi:hypothetical protein